MCHNVYTHDGLKGICFEMHLISPSCSLAQSGRSDAKHAFTQSRVVFVVSVRLLAGVILQARCVIAAQRAARLVGRTPPTASAAKSLSSCTSTSVWRSVLRRTPCETGSASAAPPPVRSATHSGAQVPRHDLKGLNVFVVFTHTLGVRNTEQLPAGLPG